MNIYEENSALNVWIRSEHDTYIVVSHFRVLCLLCDYSNSMPSCVTLHTSAMPSCVTLQILCLVVSHFTRVLCLVVSHFKFYA